MADVFISYAREDRARAEQIAQALVASGLDVFWDNEIPPGTTWADYIEAKLTQCRALIVLWSETSTKSQWVREEARLGRDKGVLIPVMIDKSQPPFGFGELQAADLSRWNGDANDVNWRRLLDAARGASSTTPSPSPSAAQNWSAPPRAEPPSMPSPQPPPQAVSRKGLPVWVWVAGAVVGTIVVLGVVGSMLPNSQNVQQAANVGPRGADAAATAPASSAQNPYEQQLLGRLGQMQQALAAQGFQELIQPVSGQLPPNQYQNLPLTLNAGADYRIVGVCDDDCSDLDLGVYDQNNNLVAQDVANDAIPIVSVTPQWNGPFTAQAVMRGCSVSPCYYAVAVYGRAARAQ